MKEITRVHIAKVAYNIELNAKKELESYVTALERYAGDKELLDDIEIRITELLAERGVRADGVISSDDVAAVRAQLGEPSDFALEGEEVVREPQDEPRRVYRDTDNAVLGGVLSGFGRFAGIDPLWVRLVFAILLFASFGSAIVIYFILWLIIPPARTAAEKLRMSGQPVTLASIKALGEKAEPAISETAVVLRRVLRVGTGLTLIVGAIVALAMVAAMAARLFLGIPVGGPVLSDMSPYEAQWVTVVFALFALAGVLLSALCVVLASAVLRRAWNKRIGTAVVAITAAGLIAFVAGIGVTMYGGFDMQAQAEKSRRVSYVNLPANFTSVKKLTALADDSEIGVGNTDITITYIVSDKPRYELDAPAGVKPEFTISDDSLSVTVKVKQVDGDMRLWGYLGSAELRIYGPALDRVETQGGAPSMRYRTDQSQAALSAFVQGTANLELHGAFDAVTLAGENGGVIDVTEAAIRSLTVDNKGGLVEAGVVRTLTVTEPDVCRSSSVTEGRGSTVRVRAVSSGRMTFNGMEQAAESVENNCGKVVVGVEAGREGQ